MVQYSDDLLGAGEEEEELVGGARRDEHRRAEYDEILLQTAMEDFEKNFAISSKL